jgi:hypothetical protein
MEQHPIPQQISSYEFKLVGEMTLKQFLKAAVGIVIALIINSMKIIFIIKWPLILLFGGGGLLLAFVPFEDRPLETWILAFLKSIYSPTIFLYKKKADKNWLDVDFTKTIQEPEKENKEENMITKDTKKVNEFIESLPSVKKDSEEKEVVSVFLGPKDNTETEIKSDEIKNQKTEAESEIKTENNIGGVVLDISEIPNVIIGTVVDQNGKIIEGAIIEIQDQIGNPIRVLKTNSLGQFKTLTQLTNGSYLIITEKEGQVFEKINIELRGQTIQPIKIKAID